MIISSDPLCFLQHTFLKQRHQNTAFWHQSHQSQTHNQSNNPCSMLSFFFNEVAYLLWFLKYFSRRLGPLRTQFLFLSMKLVLFSLKFSMLLYIDGLRLPSNTGCLIEQVVPPVGIIYKFHWQGYSVGFQVVCKILKTSNCEPCWNLLQRLSLYYDSSCQVFSVIFSFSMCSIDIV